MARAGLGPSWECLFANDFDPKKAATYINNWGPNEMYCGDVASIKPTDLRGTPDLVWASFPCQDLSLAGDGKGLEGERSGSFWPFWELIQTISREGRKPKAIVLENVVGTITSRGGKDFTALCSALREMDFQFGALVVDAALYLPQSRPRLFIIAVDKSVPQSTEIVSIEPNRDFHTKRLCDAALGLPNNLRDNWVWWQLKRPPKRNSHLSDFIETNPIDVNWNSKEQTQKLLSMMSDVNRRKLALASTSGKLEVGTVYRRTRKNADGEKLQRAEVRFDGVAGCLRTPAGGSSRQTIILVKGKEIKTRLLSGRETARLMGLPEDYQLPESYNETYHLTGDGLAVPVVSAISEQILLPILREHGLSTRAA